MIEKTKKIKNKKEAVVKKEPKKPTENFSKFFNQLKKEIEDLNLTISEFKDVHGGYRMSCRGMTICDCRIAEYGVRFYLSRDGLSKPTRIESNDDVKRCANMMRAFLYGITESDDGEVVYHNGSFSTESKKAFVEHLLKKEY